VGWLWDYISGDPSPSPPFRVQTNAARFDLSPDWPFLAIQQGQGGLSTRLRFQRNQVVFPSTWISSSHWLIFIFFLWLFYCLSAVSIKFCGGARKTFYHFYFRFCISRNLCRVMTTGLGVWSDIWQSFEWQSSPRGSRVSLTKRLKPHLIDTAPALFLFHKMHLTKKGQTCHIFLTYWLIISQFETLAGWSFLISSANVNNDCHLNPSKVLRSSIVCCMHWEKTSLWSK